MRDLSKLATYKHVIEVWDHFTAEVVMNGENFCKKEVHCFGDGQVGGRKMPALVVCFIACPDEIRQQISDAINQAADRVFEENDFQNLGPEKPA